jgi:hypothetical protein
MRSKLQEVKYFLLVVIPVGGVRFLGGKRPLAASAGRKRDAIELAIRHWRMKIFVFRSAASPATIVIGNALRLRHWRLRLSGIQKGNPGENPLF